MNRTAEITKIRIPLTPKPRFVLAYLDTDDLLKIEIFKDVEIAMQFIGELKLSRNDYLLLYGEYLYGPNDIETRVPELFMQDIDEVGESESNIKCDISVDELATLLPDREVDTDEQFRI